MAMAADQRKKRLSSANVFAYASREQHKMKKKHIRPTQFDVDWQFSSHINLQWDDHEKKVIAKGEQVGLLKRHLASWTGSLPCLDNTLADVVSVPKDIFQLDDLAEVLSYEVWQSILSQKDRNFLLPFLPTGVDPDEVVQSLLSGDNFLFGNPMLKWGSSLCVGDLHPDFLLHLEQTFKADKKAYCMELQNYHENMIKNLQMLKERCTSVKDPEREIMRIMSRSKRHPGKNTTLVATELKSRDLGESVAVTSESSSWIQDDKAYSSDVQNFLMCKGAETSRSKGSNRRKDQKPAGSSDMIKVISKSKKLHKANINISDGTKYMSYVKISKAQHELVKSMKQSGNSIQSKALNRVLGNLDNFHVKPYVMFEEEEQSRIHDYWLNLATKDLPSAFANWKKMQSDKLQIMKSLCFEMEGKVELWAQEEENECSEEESERSVDSSHGQEDELSLDSEDNKGDAPGSTEDDDEFEQPSSESQCLLHLPSVNVNQEFNPVDLNEEESNSEEYDEQESNPMDADEDKCNQVNPCEERCSLMDLNEEEQDKMGLNEQEHDQMGLNEQQQDQMGINEEEHDQMGLSEEEHDQMGLSEEEHDQMGLSEEEHDQMGLNEGLTEEEHDQMGLNEGLTEEEHDQMGLTEEEHDQIGLTEEEHDQIVLSEEERDQMGLNEGLNEEEHLNEEAHNQMGRNEESTRSPFGSNDMCSLKSEYHKFSEAGERSVGGCLETHSPIDAESKAPCSSSRDAWPDIGMLAPSSHQPSSSMVFASHNDLARKHSQVIEDHSAHLIDLASNGTEENASKNVLHEQPSELPFFGSYQNHDQNELLHSLVKHDGFHQPELKKPPLEFNPTPNMLIESAQYPGHMRNQLPPSFVLEHHRRRELGDFYMHPNIQESMYPSNSQFSIPRQEQFNPIDMRDWSSTSEARFTAPIHPQLGSGELLNHNWLPPIENRVQGGWSGPEGSVFNNPSLGSGSAGGDQSLFSVLSHCNNLQPRAPFNAMGPGDRFMPMMNYGEEFGGGIPRNGNPLVQNVSSPLDYLSGHDAAPAPTTLKTNNMGWMNLPHRFS